MLNSQLRDMSETRSVRQIEARMDLGLVSEARVAGCYGADRSSNGIRLDLMHPNEYIRGNTLRFLCKVRDPELVEPLLAPARQCLEHRHAYVRKNAVFAVSQIYLHHEAMIPDAPDLIANFLNEENDPTCKYVTSLTYSLPRYILTTSSL
jgi:hypothetical protein